jgi:hypothetical protein
MPSVESSARCRSSPRSDRISPLQQRQRAEFIRTAIKQAIRKTEFEAMKKAYWESPWIARVQVNGGADVFQAGSAGADTRPFGVASSSQPCMRS